MDRAFKDKWVAALRSGDFAQTKGRLHDGQGYCCLGVAECLNGSKFITSNDRLYYVENSTQFDWLTYETKNAAGLANTEGVARDDLPIEVGGKSYAGLSEANDDGRTFAEIADAIEANWERL